MKALIVINIEDKAFEYYSKQNPNALTVDLMDHIGESRGFYRPKFISLKPMPQKKTKLKGRGKDHCEYSLLEQLEYRKGFNDCVDKILEVEE